MVFTEQTGSWLKLNGDVLLPSAIPPAAAPCLRDGGTELSLGSREATGMGVPVLQPCDTSGLPARAAGQGGGKACRDGVRLR